MVVPETVSISRLAASRLPSELNRQINKDGSFGEASSFYGRLVLEGFALAAACTDSHTDSRAWRGRLASGAAALKNLTRTDGSMAQLGDNDSGRYLPLGDHPVLGARGVIAIIAAMLDDSELAPPAGDWWEDAVWMYGSDALELMKQGRERDGDSITSLNEAGWYTANLGEAHLTVSCGPVGLSGIGAHAHNDKLSFELFAGEPLIVDPGTYCYTLDPEFRNAFRSTRAHSTLMLDGAEQVPFTDQVFELPDLTRAKCGIFERRDERVVFQGSHRGYQQRFGVKHIRRISLGRHELSIEDRLEGGGKHDVKIGFPLAPGLTVEIDGSQAIIQGSRISARLNAPGALTVEDAEYSPGYLQREKCLRVVYRDQVSLPCSIETSISWSAD